MDDNKRDKTRVNPVSGAEDKEPPAPLQAVPEGQKANATTADIPGTGEVIKDECGKEVKRVVRT